MEEPVFLCPFLPPFPSLPFCLPSSLPSFLFIKRNAIKLSVRLNRYYTKEDTQMAVKHRKILSIINHQVNANKNHSETPPYPLE